MARNWTKAEILECIYVDIEIYTDIDISTHFEIYVDIDVDIMFRYSQWEYMDVKLLLP